MKKTLIGLGILGALAFTACGSEPETSGFDSYEQPSDNAIADAAWDTLSSSDQELLCIVISDGVQSDELAAFQEGSNGAFTDQEAMNLLAYLAGEKC